MTDENQSREQVQKALGEQIKSLRIKKGWSQKTLAELSGTTTVHIARIERGELDIHLSTLFALSEAFQSTISQLFRGIG